MLDTPELKPAIRLTPGKVGNGIVEIFQADRKANIKV